MSRVGVTRPRTMRNKRSTSMSLSSRRRPVPFMLLTLLPLGAVAWSPSQKPPKADSLTSLQQAPSTLERAETQQQNAPPINDLESQEPRLSQDSSSAISDSLSSMTSDDHDAVQPHIVGNNNINKKMTTHRDFYDLDAWRQGWTTVDSHDCYELDASFPSDLVGTFVQNGPAKFQIGDELVLHPFDGDGMLRAVTFQNGKAWYRHRFIETNGYQREQQANKIMYRGVFGTRKSPAWTNVMDVNLKNVANTHVLHHNNRLFGLWDAGVPVELDPVTLQTLNPHVMHYGDRFGAHYKEDPNTKTLCSFCLHPGLPNPNTSHRLIVSEHSDRGALLHRQEFQLPGLSMGHDMGITRKYFALLHPPCSMNLADFLLGRKGPAQCTEFDAAGSTTLWLIPRRGGPKISVSLPAPAVFCTHVSNAFENDQGHVVIDAIVATDMKMCDSNADQARPIWETMDFDEYPAFELVRYTVDPSTGQFLSSQSLSRDAGHVDFPVIHPDYVGRSYTYAYCNVGASSVKNAPLQGLAKLNVDTGDLMEKWLPQADEYLSEVVVSPKVDAVAEDDVYLVATLIRGASNSEVVVFDGRNISRGPIQRAQLRHRLPHALHGSFLEGFTPQMTDAVRHSFRR